MSKKSRRTRRIADGSLRTTTWQEQEYARLKGEEALERQVLNTKLEKGQCICRHRVIRTKSRDFRTVHDPNCPKFKDWMREYVESSVNPSGAAHAEAIHVTEVDRVMEEAIQRADEAVTQTWRDHAHEMILLVARRQDFLTSEDVWNAGLRRPDTGSPDGDALGPAMRRAAVAGFIENTGKLTQETDRAQRHKNPKRIWRSLVRSPE